MDKFQGSNGLLHIFQKIKSIFDSKVDKVSGKGLSTNDFTDEYKSEVEKIKTDCISKAYFVGTTAPSNTNIFWVDTGNNGVLKYYNGSAWVVVSSVWS